MQSELAYWRQSGDMPIVIQSTIFVPVHYYTAAYNGTEQN